MLLEAEVNASCSELAVAEGLRLRLCHHQIWDLSRSGQSRFTRHTHHTMAPLAPSAPRHAPRHRPPHDDNHSDPTAPCAKAQN